jgi:hypothetical protein
MTPEQLAELRELLVGKGVEEMTPEQIVAEANADAAIDAAMAQLEDLDDAGRSEIHRRTAPTAPAAPLNGARAPNGTPTNGAAAKTAVLDVEDLAATLLVSGSVSMRQAEQVVRDMPPGAATEVVLFCLPDDWRDGPARALLDKLTHEEGATVCAWLARQWWDGYTLGHQNALAGEDLRAPNG